MLDRPNKCDKKAENGPSANTAKRTNAAKIIREYLQKKRTLFALPRPTFGSHTTLQDNDRFLLSKKCAGDTFFVPVAGMKSLVAGLNRGNCKLLEYYFQQGINPIHFIYDAYFRGQGEYKVTLDLVGMIASIHAAVTEFIGSEKPGGKIRCFPILSKNNAYTFEAIRFLLPYLTRVFRLSSRDTLTLQHQIAKIPAAERYFATIDWSDEILLGALHIIIGRCLQHIKNRDFTDCIWKMIHARNMFISPANPYRSQLKAITDNLFQSDIQEKLVVNMAFSKINKILSQVKSQMLKEHPEVASCTIYSNLLYQLLSADIPIVFPVSSPGDRNVAIVVTSGKVLDLGLSLAYGEENRVSRFTGYGLFDAADIAAATRDMGRIINVPDVHIQGLSKAHYAPSGPWTLQAHDLGHWWRMGSVPVPMRRGLLAWAKMLADVTGFSLSSLSYWFYDMDMCGYEYNNHDSYYKYSITANIDNLVEFYERHHNGYIENETELFEYYLIIMFEMLKNPNWMRQTFSHCSARADAYENILFHRLQQIYKNSTGGVNCQDLFNSHASTTHNVYIYLLYKTERQRQLSALASIFLRELADKINIFKWTRNSGLKLGGDKEIFVRDITNDTLPQALSLYADGAKKQDKENDFIAYLQYISTKLAEHNSKEDEPLSKLIKQTLDKFKKTSVEPMQLASGSDSRLFGSSRKRAKHSADINSVKFLPG